MISVKYVRGEGKTNGWAAEGYWRDLGVANKHIQIPAVDPLI